MPTFSRFRSLPLAVLLLGLSAAPLAFAHATLVRSTPTANATVEQLERIHLEFNEAVIARASRVELFMAHGQVFMSVPVTATQVLKDGRTLQVTPTRPLATGSYQVRWRAVGPDGHPMEGKLDFRVR